MRRKKIAGMQTNLETCGLRPKWNLSELGGHCLHWCASLLTLGSWFPRIGYWVASFYLSSTLVKYIDWRKREDIGITLHEFSHTADVVSTCTNRGVKPIMGLVLSISICCTFCVRLSHCFQLPWGEEANIVRAASINKYEGSHAKFHAYNHLRTAPPHTINLRLVSLATDWRPAVYSCKHVMQCITRALSFGHRAYIARMSNKQ